MNIYIVCTDKHNLLQAFPMSSFLFFYYSFLSAYPNLEAMWFKEGVDPGSTASVQMS